MASDSVKVRLVRPVMGFKKLKSLMKGEESSRPSSPVSTERAE